MAALQLGPCLAILSAVLVWRLSQASRSEEDDVIELDKKGEDYSHQKEETLSNYKIDKNRTLKVKGRQGIALDKEFYYTSGSTSLYKYKRVVGNNAAAPTLETSNELPFVGYEAKANHIGDIDVYGGEVYVGAEQFDLEEDVDGKKVPKFYNVQIAIHDANTLKFNRSISVAPESGMTEVAGVGVDADNGLVWMCSWLSGSHVWKYALNGTYMGRVKLVPEAINLQGIAYYDGLLWITADDGDTDRNEADNVYSFTPERVEGEPDEIGTLVLAKKTKNVAMHGEIEGLVWDGVNDELLIHNNHGLKIVQGKTMGPYKGFQEEVHEIYFYTKGD